MKTVLVLMLLTVLASCASRHESGSAPGENAHFQSQRDYIQ